MGSMILWPKYKILRHTKLEDWNIRGKKYTKSRDVNYGSPIYEKIIRLIEKMKLMFAFKTYFLALTYDVMNSN